MFVKLVNDCGRNDNNIFPLKGKSNIKQSQNYFKQVFGKFD